ncbi:GAF domain-containing protein [Comamonas kerstersii]|uniref:GAF domain-containing protein n=1 Tax=Comamonas kerstersii TaxID=225992 RepID=UPI001B33A0D0|nr:GAF domain-containing protein [Comamonas kerstersii]QTW17639.1 GAF domain-containing protein [Comamonas kerstersii]
MTYKPDSLQLHGIYATCASHALTATVAQEATQGWGDVQWLVVSVFHAQPQPMVRQLLRRVRRRYPHTQIILALWNAGPDVLTEESLARMGAASVVTSLQELLLRMQQLVSPEQGQQGYMPDSDAERVQALQRSGLRSPSLLPAYKEAVLKAANAFHVKYAQVSLVDHEWVHTPGSLLAHDHAPDELPGLARDISICSYVVHDGEALVVEDVARDPRFANNPALQEAEVKFYAGVPLRNRQGDVLGTLCIMDEAPRQMAEGEMDVLQEMAKELEEALRIASQDKGSTANP